jgi:putative peptidoglycan lipid II flippase
MVKKFLGAFNKEISGMHDAAYLLGLFALISQLLGLLRDRFLANHFGAGEVMDLYYGAFRVPDFIFAVVASLVSFSVLIPYLENKKSEGPLQMKKFMDTIFSFFFLSIIVTCGIAMIFMPHISKLLFVNLGDVQLAQVTTLSRIMLLSPFFLGLSNLLASVTQIHKRFLLYAITPLVYNVSIICSIVFLTPRMGISGVAVGVVFGAFLHALVQMPFARSVGLLPDFTIPFSWQEVKKVIIPSLPRTITLSSASLVMIILVSIASKLEVGSIAIFTFSMNLYYVPLSIIGISYSMAAFPVLSALVTRGEKEKFISQIVGATRHIVFLSLPIMVLFIVLRAQIVRTILGSGNFNWSDTRLTAACFALFSLCVVFQSIGFLITRAYYASGKTKEPFFIALFSSVVTVCLPVLFLKLFAVAPRILEFISSMLKVDRLQGLEILALPLGFSIGTIIQSVALFFFFKKEFPFDASSIYKTFFQSFIAALIAGFTAYIGLNIFDNFFDLTTLKGIFLQGFLAGVIGIFAHIYFLKIVGSEELKEFMKTIKHKIWKAKPVFPETSEM